VTEQAEPTNSRQAAMEVLLSQPVLARIATVSMDAYQPHVVPVWFHWDGESVWISSYRSTRKIKDLRNNPKCSIVIDITDDSVAMRAVLFEGRAELVTEPRDLVHRMSTQIYTKYLGPEGVLAPDPQEWIHSPENLLIKLTPEQIFSW
jgi:nitroimidazol reductase NimA-like FMN-containing flavoprotein (pyridoxamine 5'-phosphate oxidase superfamily)